MKATNTTMNSNTCSISPISIKDLVYASTWNNTNRQGGIGTHTATSQQSDSDKEYDETWQPNRKDRLSVSIIHRNSSANSLRKKTTCSVRRIRKIGPDGSYYDCDSCAVPEGGWQKYWKEKISFSLSLESKATDSSDSTSSCDDDWLGDTLICCENCPVTLHFACVCPPLTSCNDIWLCASCRNGNKYTSLYPPPTALVNSSRSSSNIQTSPLNIQYQLSSWKWLFNLSPTKEETQLSITYSKHSLKHIFVEIAHHVSSRNTTEFTPQWIVFSAFDGIAAARLALERLGVGHVRYYASEIDTNAIQVAHTRFPDIIPLGDIRQVTCQDIPEGVDFMIGGSPCQSLSRLGHQQGIQSGPSSLFFEYVRLLKEWKPRYFLLENVASMNANDRQIITKALGVEPILVDAARFSAGIRYRYYWTNIPNAKRIFTFEEKPNCYLQDILVDHARAQYPKAYTITTNNYAPRAFDNRFNTVWYSDQEKRGLNIIEAERILG